MRALLAAVLLTLSSCGDYSERLHVRESTVPIHLQFLGLGPDSIGIQQHTGTAFVIGGVGDRLHLLTSGHVCEPDALVLGTIRMAVVLNGDVHVAKLESSSNSPDVCVVSINRPSEYIVPATCFSRKPPEYSSRFYARAYPLGLHYDGFHPRFPATYAGLLHFPQGDVYMFVVTAKGGSSGGPVVGPDGVVGIVKAIIPDVPGYTAVVPSSRILVYLGAHGHPYRLCN